MTQPTPMRQLPTPMEPLTNKQTYELSKLLQDKLGLKMWMLLNEKSRIDEKANPTDIEYYRLSPCVYNGFNLVNIVRFYQDPSKKVKGKSWATINMHQLKATTASQNKFIFTDDELAQVKSILNPPKTDSLAEAIQNLPIRKQRGVKKHPL